MALLFTMAVLSILVLPLNEYTDASERAQTASISISSLSSKAARPSAELLVTPATLSFGKLNVSTTLKISKSIKITDRGKAPLIVNVNDAVGAAFSVTSGGGQATIVPGEDLIVSILFTPPSGGTGRNSIVPSRFAGSVSITATPVSGSVLRGGSAKTIHLVGSSTGVLSSNANPALTAFPNPGDPNLAKASLTDGSSAIFVGTKDGTGIPQVINGFVAGSPDLDPAKTVAFTVDDQGRPAMGRLPDGSQVAIEYTSDTQIGLTITDCA